MISLWRSAKLDRDEPAEDIDPDRELSDFPWLTVLVEKPLLVVEAYQYGLPILTQDQ
jgi:hypothetical protein